MGAGPGGQCPGVADKGQTRVGGAACGPLLGGGADTLPLALGRGANAGMVPAERTSTSWSAGSPSPRGLGVPTPPLTSTLSPGPSTHPKRPRRRPWWTWRLTSSSWCPPRLLWPSTEPMPSEDLGGEAPWGGPPTWDGAPEPSGLLGGWLMGVFEAWESRAWVPTWACATCFVQA